MKELKDLTLKEHTDLKRSGLMWVIFPDATGNFRDDCESAEPLIVRSGETWVAHWEGVDYLRTESLVKILDKPCFFYTYLDKVNTNIIKEWKSFTGPNPDITELTDELAKLRPMVVIEKTKLYKLYAVNNDWEFPYLVDEDSTLNSGLNRWANCRLATAKELQEQSDG